jgi:hypothetical protein
MVEGHNNASLGTQWSLEPAVLGYKSGSCLVLVHFGLPLSICPSLVPSNCKFNVLQLTLLNCLPANSIFSPKKALKLVMELSNLCGKHGSKMGLKTAYFK